MRCSECGQFCRPVDSGTFYGHCNDTDPPDPDFFCARCAKRNMDEAIKTPERIISRCWWIKPDYVLVAKSILRNRRAKTKRLII